MKWENIRRKYYTSSRVSITFTTLHLWHNDGHQNERSQHLCVMESIRIQVQFYVRYFTNYFLTSLENCLVYIFLSIVTSVDALNICAARHMWPLIKIIKHKQESANLKKGLRKKGGRAQWSLILEVQYLQKYVARLDWKTIPIFFLALKGSSLIGIFGWCYSLEIQFGTRVYESASVSSVPVWEEDLFCSPKNGKATTF